MSEVGSPNGCGKLTLAQQEYVVARLAAYETPGAIARSLRAQLGIRISRQGVSLYDPTRSRRCPRRWKAVFLTTRQAMLRGKGVRRAAGRKVRLRAREAAALRAIEAFAGEVIDVIVAPPAATQLPPAAMPPPTDRERARAILALLQLDTRIRP